MRILIITMVSAISALVPSCARRLAADQNAPAATLRTAVRMAEKKQSVDQVSRRRLVLGAAWASGLYYGGIPSCASAYTIQEVKPNENDTYALAQKGKGPLRVLWVGPVGEGLLRQVDKDLFPAGNEVIAFDLKRPEAADLSASSAYAAEHGYQLRFEQGDATKLKYSDASFDVVVSSMFLCQGTETNHPLPNWSEVVVSEIRRVLKPGGRFGFYEHVEDIDKVIVGKVFGERAVVRIEWAPEKLNIMAGVVRKV